MGGIAMNEPLVFLFLRGAGGTTDMEWRAA